MPELKLTYFNGRGLAEFPRWVFAYGDIPFTDERVRRDEWPELKKTTPAGKMPVLKIDDKTLWQSNAIARYGATLAGLVPSDPRQAAFTDACVETFKEALLEHYNCWLSEDKSDEEKKKIRVEAIEPILQKMNKSMENKTWMISDKITWADIMYGRLVEEFSREVPEVLKKYPIAVAHAEKVQQLPRIKELREKRSVTPF